MSVTVLVKSDVGAPWAGFWFCARVPLGRHRGVGSSEGIEYRVRLYRRVASVVYNVACWPVPSVLSRQYTVASGVQL